MYSPIAVNAIAVRRPAAGLGDGHRRQRLASTCSSATPVSTPPRRTGWSRRPSSPTPWCRTRTRLRPRRRVQQRSRVRPDRARRCFRLALPPDSTEAGADLDVYVYDPNGDLVATSTARWHRRGNDHLRPDGRGRGRCTCTAGRRSAPTPTTTCRHGSSRRRRAAACRSTRHPTEAVLGDAGTVEASWAGAADALEPRCGLALGRQRRAWATPWSRSTTAERLHRSRKQEGRPRRPSFFL